MPNTKTGTTWAPDIRPGAIETFTETYTPDGGTEQTLTYKRVADHPILNGIRDIKAFFTTHVGAVWYNLQERKTLLAKLNEMDAEIGRMNFVYLNDSSPSFAPWTVIKTQWDNIPTGAVIGTIKSGYTYSIEGEKTDNSYGSFIIHCYDGGIYHVRRYGANWHYAEISRINETEF